MRARERLRKFQDLTDAVQAARDSILRQLKPRQESVGKQIEISLAFDDQFIPHAAVTLLSATAATTCPKYFRLHVMQTGDIGAIDRSTFDRRTLGTPVLWCDVDGNRFAAIPVNREQVSRANCLRLANPELLRPDVTRVLYLDSDIVVTDRLTQLFETDIEGAPIAAAPDVGGATQVWRLGLPETAFYISAGVLLFDFEALDIAEMEAQCAVVIDTRGSDLELQDQDILNLIFVGRAHQFRLRWNANTKLYTTLPFDPNYGLEKARTASQAPGALHFTDRRKTWLSNCIHLLRELFWELRNQTPWRESVPRSMLRRLEGVAGDRFIRSRREAGFGG